VAVIAGAAPVAEPATGCFFGMIIDMGTISEASLPATEDRPPMPDAPELSGLAPMDWLLPEHAVSNELTVNRHRKLLFMTPRPGSRSRILRARIVNVTLRARRGSSSSGGRSWLSLVAALHAAPFLQHCARLF
jgi:hypothetical protein